MALDIADLAQRAVHLAGGNAIASVSLRRELVVLAGPHGALLPPRRTFDVLLRLLIRDGAGRLGVARCSTSTSDAALRALVDRARDNAGVSAFTLTALPTVGAAADHGGFDLLTADLDPAAASAAARDAAAAVGYDLGAARTARWRGEDVAVAVATADGAFAQDRRTGARLDASCVDADGRLVGMAQASAVAADQLDPLRVGAAATPPAAAAYRPPQPLVAGPGEPVVLLPAALAPLLEALARVACTGHAHATGTSPFTGRLGTVVANPLITLWDDPTASTTLARGIDVEGVAALPTCLIERGVERGVVHDTASADEAGAVSTGHAAELGGCGAGPAPRNLILEAGDAAQPHALTGSGASVVVPYVESVTPTGPGMSRFSALGRGAYVVTDGRPSGLLGDVMLAGDLTDVLAGIDAMSAATELVASLDRLPERTRATTCPAARTTELSVVAL